MRTEAIKLSLADVRQARGLAIVQKSGDRIKHIVGESYFCPSSMGGKAGYVVNLAENTCTCEDAETCAGRCKHQWAVLILRREVELPDGVRLTTKRPTYTQNWPAYNRAQCEEKERVQILLRGLCDGIVQPPQGNGRPRYPLADVIYGAVMKVYTTVSGRRATTDIRECERRGYIAQAPAYNSLFRYVENPDLKPLLTQLVEESAAPLRAVESTFAADATGFATNSYARWFDHKYGTEKRVQQWVKAHAMVGTTTHIITALSVTPGHDNDSPQFTSLLETTHGNGFDMKEVSADKAYLSNANLAAVEATGAVPYIPFKVNSTPTGNTAAWQRLWHYFSLEREDFLSHYHKRSNVESAFSSAKRKFGGALRSKLPAAQHNEVLLKCLCHNLSMLVHAIHELGVEPRFWMPAITRAS